MVIRKLFFLVFIVPVLLNSAISFKEPSLLPIVFDVGRNPRGIASDDFNGDGKFDIAAVGEEIDKDIPNRGYLYVFLGDGDFGFQAPISYKLPTTPAIGYGYGIVTGDFDKDGRIDIFVASAELKQVLFFKGMGDGTFKDPVGTDLNYRPEGLQCADLNNDGNLDLITCNRQDNNISILLGSGDGSFFKITNHSTNSSPSDCAIGDLNGDGFSDIVVATYTNPSLNVFLNDGTGNFPSSSTQYDTRIQSNGLFLADFNEDNFLDVVMLGRGGFTDHPGTIGFVKGLGNGTFEVPVPSGNYQWIGIEDYLGHKFSPFEVIDINNDGHKDIIGTYPTTNDKNYFFVGLGKGDGTFELFNFIASPGDGSTANLQPDQIHSVSSIAKDFNLDGILDIAVTTAQSPSGRGGGISIIKGTSQGLFYSPRSFPSGRSRSASGKGTTTGDFDNDGKTDIVSLTDRIDFLKGLGDGTFQEGQLAFSGYETGYSLTKADFDKDGKQDLVWGQSYIWNQPLTLYVIYGQGNGTFSAGNKIQWGSNGQTVENVLVADFNNDTYPDIACFSHTSDSFPNIIANLDVFLYDPSNPRNFIHSDSSPNLNIGTTRGSAFALGDVDNDGNIDLIAFGVGPNRILFFKGLGNGTFNSAIEAGTTGAEPYFDSILKDINKDGKLDLIIGTYDNLYIHIGNGDGTFAAYSTISNPTSISQIASEDLDGDGNPDIATAHGSTSGSDGFSVLKGNGDGTFGPLQRFSVGNRSAYSLNISDLNGDGKLDIVVEHNGSNYNHFTILINDSGPRADLSITKTLISSDENIFNYTIGITNPGPDAAVDVRVIDPIRSNGIFLSAIPSQGGCQITSKNLICNLLNIPALSTASISVQIQSMDLNFIENTASVLSSTNDSNTSNNAAISIPIQNMKFLKIYGAENVEVGTEETYSILYYNQLSTPLNDVVIVFDIPNTSEYVSSSNNGIFRYDLNQVFWKLGTVPAKGSGVLFVKVSIPWGIPPHTHQTMLAMFGAQGQADNPFDLDDYLMYTGRKATHISDLTPSEISDLLQNDPTLNLYHSYCQNYGFSFYNKGTNMLFDDGSSVNQLWEINPDTAQISSPTKSNLSQVIELASKDSISYMNTQEGIRYNPQDSSFSTFTISGGPPPSIRMEQPTWTRCFFNCMIENVAMWILTDKIKALGIISDFFDCEKCFRAKDEPSCIKCGNVVADKLGKKVPFVGEILDIIACKKDCDEDPNSHVCVSGTSKLKCEECNTFDKFFGCQNVIQRKYDCGLGGVYSLGPETIFCAWCSYNEVQVCNGDNCACIPCDLVKTDCRKGEILVAHDPNYKEGMGGFVSRGQTLNFKIHYENEGTGTAYDVYIMDKLDENLDETTLSIQNGGEFYPSVRTIYWQIGNLNPGQGGVVEFSVNVKNDAPLGEWIKNQAAVVFPSVPETTYTNLLSAEIKAITAYSQNLQMNEGESLPITLEGFDPLGFPLNYLISQNPINGEITGTPPNIIYTPNQNFEGQDEFKFTVDNGIQTSEPGTIKINVLSNTSDNIPPEVIFTFPSDGSSIYPYQEEYQSGFYLPAIKGCFNEPIDQSTVNSSNVILTDGITDIPGQAFFDSTDNCIYFLLTQPLSFGTQYTVILGTGIKDTSGNNLSQNYSWSFFTYQNAQLNSNPKSLDFGTVEANNYLDKILEIHNTGGIDLNISSAYITGTNQERFSIQNDGCSGKILNPNSFCVLNIRFSPDFNGYYEAYLTISSNVGNLDVQIYGNGFGGNCLALLGDINANNHITAYDASLILQAVVGLITLTPLQECSADVNENSSVSAYDASLTLQCTVGLCSALPSNFKTSCTNHGNCP